MQDCPDPWLPCRGRAGAHIPCHTHDVVPISSVLQDEPRGGSTPGSCACLSVLVWRLLCETLTKDQLKTHMARTEPRPLARMAPPLAPHQLSWQPRGWWGFHHSWQRIITSCLNQGVPQGDVWFPGTEYLGKVGSPHTCLHSRPCSAWWLLLSFHKNWMPRAAPFPCLCANSLLSSSEMIIPLTRKVMTLIHYFKCHLCKVINQLNVRLDYILILIVLNSHCF